MSVLATLDRTDEVVPAPAPMRPVHLSEVRPWDRIAFRPRRAGEGDEPAPTETGPRLVWPRAVDPVLPDPSAWAGALARTCVEVLLGARPPAQLARWLTTDLYTTLSRRALSSQRRPSDAHRVRVLRVHLCHLDDACCEASVVFHDGRRVRAAALRIEAYRNRWRATALEIG